MNLFSHLRSPMRGFRDRIRISLQDVDRVQLSHRLCVSRGDSIGLRMLSLGLAKYVLFNGEIILLRNYTASIANPTIT
jgi:hypothetical protein